MDCWVSNMMFIIDCIDVARVELVSSQDLSRRQGFMSVW